MLKILNDFFSWIFPPPQACLISAQETPETFKRFYSLSQYKKIYFLSHYQEQVIKAAIIANKFYDDNHASNLLATLLEKWLEELSYQSLVLIPIPLSQERERERGYNQVERILEALPVKYKKVSLLKKVRHTKAQVTLKREERLQNMETAFSLVDDDYNMDTTYIIVDDVTTTGSTLKEAEKTLKDKLGPFTKVILVAIAH